MSRTKRKVNLRWGLDVKEELYLKYHRGHLCGNYTAFPRRNGGWYGYADLPYAVDSASQKRYDKRRCSKMRRREAKTQLRQQWASGVLDPFASENER